MVETEIDLLPFSQIVGQMAKGKAVAPVRGNPHIRHPARFTPWMPVTGDTGKTVERVFIALGGPKNENSIKTEWQRRFSYTLQTCIGDNPSPASAGFRPEKSARAEYATAPARKASPASSNGQLTSLQQLIVIGNVDSLKPCPGHLPKSAWSLGR